MARRSRAQRLNVFLNARHVGKLERAGSGAISFAYDPKWLAWESAMPVSISLPLRSDKYTGADVTNVFENLLPDAERVRKNVAERLKADGTDPFSLLAVAGRDCVGALQFLTDGDEPGPAGEVNGEPISEACIAELIRKLRVNPLGLDPEDDDFRISIAGAQDKTALLKLEGGWHRPVGSTATTHILKPAIGVILDDFDLSDSVQNEFVCMKFCEALGLKVAGVEIKAFEDQLALSVERFDRLWTSDGRLIRLPQEDFCQALSIPSTRKYQRDDGPGIGAILERLKESDRPFEDRKLFLKAQIVFWLIGATDGHAKNFSIAHTPRGGFGLTPLYDVLTAQPLVDAGRLRRNRFKLAMSVGENNHRRMDKITRRHYQQTADAAGLEKKLVEKICAEIEADLPTALATIGELQNKIVSAELISSFCGGITSRSEALFVEP